MQQTKKILRRPRRQTPPPQKVEVFVAATLGALGLKRGEDFNVTSGQLTIRKYPVRGFLLNALKEIFPQYSYYWETPRILSWF